MIKRYFIVVLLLFLFPAGVSAQRRPAAKKDWKAKYDYVGAAHDGRILVHRGGEGSDPRMGRFYTDGCFGYTDTCGTVFEEFREIVHALAAGGHDFDDPVRGTVAALVI